LPVKDEEVVSVNGPKAPPRIKKKYRKSKTTDLSRYQQMSSDHPSFNSNLSVLKDEDADSLESDNEAIPKAKLTPIDSLSPANLSSLEANSKLKLFNLYKLKNKTKKNIFG
jgi:hypothetical protein